MNKKGSAVLSRSQLDTQRLEEIFFSSTPKKPEEKKKKFALYYSLAVGLILSLYLLFNFELVIIPKAPNNTKPTNSNLIKEKSLVSYRFLNNQDYNFKVIGSSIYGSVPLKGKIGIELNFAKPQNLDKNVLILWLKKSPLPVTIDIIAKDNNFISNAKDPLTITVNEQNLSSFIKVPIQFKSEESRMAISRVKQIKVFFYHTMDTENISQSNNLDGFANNWLIIKNIAFFEKEKK